MHVIIMKTLRDGIHFNASMAFGKYVLKVEHQEFSEPINGILFKNSSRLIDFSIQNRQIHV